MTETEKSYDAAWAEEAPATGTAPVVETAIPEVVEGEVIQEPELPEGDEPASGEDALADDIDYKALYEKEKLNRQSDLGRFKSKVEELKRQGVAVDESVQPRSTQQPTSDPDDAFLNGIREKYEEDILKAVDIVASRRAKEMMTAFAEQNLAPLARSTQELAAEAHFAKIEALHPDAYAIDESQEFDDWINEKPVHVRGAYQFVREQGSPEEVISMLNEYKASQKPTPSTQKADPQKVGAAAAVPRARAGLPAAPKTAAEKRFDTAWEQDD